MVPMHGDPAKGGSHNIIAVLVGLGSINRVQFRKRRVVQNAEKSSYTCSTELTRVQNAVLLIPNNLRRDGSGRSLHHPTISRKSRFLALFSSHGEVKKAEELVYFHWISHELAVTYRLKQIAR